MIEKRRGEKESDRIDREDGDKDTKDSIIVKDAIPC